MKAGLQRYRKAGMAAAAGLLLLGWVAPGWAAQALRVGVVDVQQILNQSERGMAIKQKLDLERATRQKELDARQQELTKLQAELEKQAPVLSEQAKREKSEVIQRKTRDARRLAEDANRELEKRVRDAENEITREIVAVIHEFGKDQGFTLILERERSAVVFSSASVDVTAEVIKRFDVKPK